MLFRLMHKDHQFFYLRNQSIAAWYKTGMTGRELSERYGICPGRIYQILQTQARKEEWRKEHQSMVKWQVGCPTGTVRRVKYQKPGEGWRIWSARNL